MGPWDSLARDEHWTEVDTPTDRVYSIHTTESPRRAGQVRPAGHISGHPMRGGQGTAGAAAATGQQRAHYTYRDRRWSIGVKGQIFSKNDIFSFTRS